jgi:hypothetical protein
VTVFAGHDTPGKPHPEPFRRALAALATPSERALLVGDSFGLDVVGARALGMATAWVADDDTPPTSSVAPAHVLDSAGDLHAALSDSSCSPRDVSCRVAVATALTHGVRSCRPDDSSLTFSSLARRRRGDPTPDPASGLVPWVRSVSPATLLSQVVSRLYSVQFRVSYTISRRYTE